MTPVSPSVPPDSPSRLSVRPFVRPLVHLFVPVRPSTRPSVRTPALVRPHCFRRPSQVSGHTLDFSKRSVSSTLVVVDCKEFFRIFPLREHQRAWFALAFNGKVAIDAFAGFGASATPGITGQLGDALVAIVEHKFPRGLRVERWVDDFAFWRTGNEPHLADILAIFRDLGVPVSHEKFQDFGHRTTFCGFVHDLSSRTISLPDAKRFKYLALVDELLRTKRATLRQTQSVLGKLQHTTQLLPAGRPRLRALGAFVCTFSCKVPDGPAFHLHTSQLRELLWWQEHLQHDIILQLRDPRPASLPSPSVSGSRPETIQALTYHNSVPRPRRETRHR